MRTFCILNLDSRLKLLDPGGRTMIASLNWNVALPSTPPMEFSTQAPPSRRRRSDLYFILLLCLPVPIHGWISKLQVYDGSNDCDGCKDRAERGRG